MPQAVFPARRVLVVEDEEPIRRVLGLALEFQGYEVMATSNGREALRVLEEKPAPGAILLDLMMPIMDGWELVTALERRPELRTLPVVALTAFNETARPVRARHVLRKPVDLDHLFKVLGSVCGADPGRET